MDYLGNDPLPIEDEVLDAIRSKANPDTILSLLDTVLAEKYTSRKELRKLAKPSFFKRVHGLVYGDRRTMPSTTERTLRSAMHLLRSKKSWSAITKLTYIKHKISFVLDRYPSRGFLSSLQRALDFYLNPNKPNIWDKLDKFNKPSAKLKKHRKKEEKDFADDENIDEDDYVDKQKTDDDDYDEDDFDFPRETTRPNHHRHTNKSNNKKRLESRESDDDGPDDEDADDNDTILKSKNVRRHKRIRTLSQSNDDDVHDQKESAIETDDFIQGTAADMKEERTQKNDSKWQIKSTGAIKNDSTVEKISDEKNSDKSLNENKNINNQVSDDNPKSHEEKPNREGK